MPAKSTSKEDLTELKSVIEAALMASDVPLSVRKIRNMFDETERPETTQVNKALAAIEKDCDSRGIELRQIGKGYRFQTKDQYAGWLRKLRDTRPPRYSRALIETLSIIAYRQPVTRGDIEGIRGVAVSSDIIRTLLDREWIIQIGHRDVPGRPALYATSDSFLEYFNLRSLSDLPALMEPREVTDVAKDLNITLPMGVPVLQPAQDVIGEDLDEDEEDEEDSVSATDAEKVVSLDSTMTAADRTASAIDDDTDEEEEDEDEDEHDASDTPAEDAGLVGAFDEAETLNTVTAGTDTAVVDFSDLDALPAEDHADQDNSDQDNSDQDNSDSAKIQVIDTTHAEDDDFSTASPEITDSDSSDVPDSEEPV